MQELAKSITRWISSQCFWYQQKKFWNHADVDRRKEENVLKKVYEEERLLKKKFEALIHFSHHTQPNSITVNFIFLGETIWFSCLSIKQWLLPQQLEERTWFSNFLKFNISIKDTLYCSCSFDSWWICWSMWWTFFYFSLEECYVCDVHRLPSSHQARCLKSKTLLISNHHSRS